MNAVLCYVDKAQSSWDEHLAQLDCRSFAVGHEPELGLHGQQAYAWREVNTPADLLYPARRQGDPVDVEAYGVDLEQALQTAH